VSHVHQLQSHDGDHGPKSLDIGQSSALTRALVHNASVLLWSMRGWASHPGLKYSSNCKWVVVDDSKAD